MAGPNGRGSTLPQSVALQGMYDFRNVAISVASVPQVNLIRTARSVASIARCLPLLVCAAIQMRSCRSCASSDIQTAPDLFTKSLLPSVRFRGLFAFVCCCAAVTCLWEDESHKLADQ